MKNFLSICTLAGLLIMTGLLDAQPVTPSQKEEAQPLIPRRLLFGNPEKASPRLSRDGTKLAYLAPDENNVLNVWVRDLKNGGPDKKITADKKRGIMSFMWQYDPNYILYVQDKDGDENNHLYQTDVKTLITRDLTPFDNVKAGVLAYDHKYPNKMLVLLNKKNPALFDVYQLDLLSGELQLDTENPGDVFGWEADHELNVRVAESYNKEGSKLIQVHDEPKGPWRVLMTIDPYEVGGGVIDFTPDEQSLYVASSVDGNTSRLLKVNLKTGQKTVVSEDPEYDLDDVMMNPVTYELEALGYDKKRYEWVLVDQKMAPDFKFLKESMKGRFRIASRDLDNQNWVVSAFSDVHPSHFYLYNRKTQDLKFLFTTQPELEKYQLSPMTPITYQARDGMTLHGYLTLPLGKKQTNLPLIIFVHGGPAVRDSWGLNTTVQWMVNRGYAVLQINYRGSSGYGKQYLNAGNKEWGAKMHTDLLDGKQWAISKGIADPNKVAIYGGSYGGYATLVGLAFTPDEFCCGVDIVGPSNLITLLKTIPPYWAVLKSQMDRRVGDLETESAFIESRSPLFKADQIKKPLLIAQGANDPRVKQAESDQIVQAMRKNHLPVEYLLFTDEGHGFARPENRLKFAAATEAFLAKYLGGRQEPPTPAEEWKSLER